MLRLVWLQRRFEGGGVVVGGFVFHHIRTVFGFFRVGNSVFTILDSERDILGQLGRAGFRLDEILGLKAYHLSLFLLFLAEEDFWESRFSF